MTIWSNSHLVYCPVSLIVIWATWFIWSNLTIIVMDNRTRHAPVNACPGVMVMGGRRTPPPPLCTDGAIFVAHYRIKYYNKVYKYYTYIIYQWR